MVLFSVFVGQVLKFCTILTKKGFNLGVFKFVVWWPLVINELNTGYRHCFRLVLRYLFVAILKFSTVLINSSQLSSTLVVTPFKKNSSLRSAKGLETEITPTF